MTETGASTPDPNTVGVTGGRKPTRKPVASRRAGAGEVLRAVNADLKRMPAELAKSALAATAKALAREIDGAKNSATSKSMCARALLDTLEELRALCPPADEVDALDDLAARRAVRRGA